MQPLEGGAPSAGPSAVGASATATASEAVRDEAVDGTALASARAALRDPAVATAEGALDVVRRVDFARHEAVRGGGMAAAVAEAREVVARLEVDADALVAAAAGVGGPAGEGAASGAAQVDAAVAARALAATARGVAGAAAAELDALRRHAEVDAAIGEVVDAWSARGTRSEFEANLTAQVDVAAAVLRAARRLPATPDGCTALRGNRIRWGRLVAARTAELRDLSAVRDGTTYDVLADRYARAPLGEDPATADAESRPCWASRSPLGDAPQRIADRVAALERALST